MVISRSTLLFFDASCLVAAAGSPNGGSGFLLSLCQRGFLRAAVSQPVLVEAERNVREKLKPYALENYHQLLADTPFELAAVPAEPDRASLAGIVGEKDEHVLAATLVSRAPFLVTLDQPLEKAVNAGHLEVRAIAAGGFIKEFLPLHPDFPGIR